jgi:hypothetical protein
MVVLHEVYPKRGILRTNVSLLPPDLKEYLLGSVYVSPALCLRLAYVLHTSRLCSAYVSPMNRSVCSLPEDESGYFACALPTPRLRSLYVLLAFCLLTSGRDEMEYQQVTGYSKFQQVTGHSKFQQVTVSASQSSSKSQITASSSKSRFQQGTKGHKRS